MATILIKQESLPTRCEICHQKDLFNPKINRCGRCNNLTPVVKRMPLLVSKNNPALDYMYSLRDHLRRNIVFCEMVSVISIWGLVSAVISNADMIIKILFNKDSVDPLRIFITSTIFLAAIFSYMLKNYYKKKLDQINKNIEEYRSLYR